ncbi:MAG TPA: hypothetical protein VIY51_12010 [Xanthobacteraceae bacterium]
MRVRLVDLSVIGLTLIGLPATGRASELDRAWLRGSQVEDTGPGYPVFPSAQSYAPPPASRSYPATSAPVRAVAPATPAQLHGFTFEFGTRIWYSTGKLAKDLFDDPRASTNLNSRLTYSGLTTATFEGFGRADTPIGAFLKGFAGFGNLRSGTLNDEDFPPGITPYSSTLSQQQGGRLAYASVDIGQTVFKTERGSIGLFAGYGFLAESTNAFGCSQVAGNPKVCVPTIASGIEAISEDTHWQFARLGILGEVKLLDRLKFSGEFAWLPFEQLTGLDTHWLRLGGTPLAISGPIPEFGGGTGFQIEAVLSYQLAERATVGLGGRYWFMETRGNADFERVIVGFPAPAELQPLNFSTTRYGGFAQGSYKFGPL